MRVIRDNDTIQIEITNACTHNCSNCTRLVHHHEKNYFMGMEMFKEAVDSLAGFTHMVGVMGGEPLLHPRFEEISLYLQSRFPRLQTGLWTGLPKGKEHYAELICSVYGHIFLNDHTRADVMHVPVLVASDELIEDKNDLWCFVEHCFAWKCWSASINPRGAFFCEIAASLAMLFGGGGWPVEPGWWLRAPIDYVDQMRRFCPSCGCAMPIKKRASTEVVDDISPKIFEYLKDRSPKIRRGEYVIHDLTLEQDNRALATYKDPTYRDRIADRYDMFLVNNNLGFQSPVMKFVRKNKPKQAAEA